MKLIKNLALIATALICFWVYLLAIEEGKDGGAVAVACVVLISAVASIFHEYE